MSSTGPHRSCIVTGGAGAIGRACVLALARDGCDVTINHFDTPADAEAVAREVAALGRKSLVAAADVSDEAAVAAMFARHEAMFGGIDVLINNAGIARDEDVFSTSLESWNRVLSVNLTGAFLCAREAMRRMAARRSGRIIQMTSVVAHQGALKGHAHYAASKAGLVGLTKTLARTGAPLGITVNAVAPGIVDTPMLSATHGEAGIARLMERVPLATLATPDDVAAAVVWLASDGARHVTGAVIDVNGGMLMR